MPTRVLRGLFGAEPKMSALACPLVWWLLCTPVWVATAQQRRLACLRYPFPDAWPAHSDNCMLVDVTRDSEEWERAATLLRASVTDATLVHLQRYASWLCSYGCGCGFLGVVVVVAVVCVAVAVEVFIILRK